MDANVAFCEYPYFVKVCLTSLRMESEELGVTGEWRKAAKVIFVSGIVTNLMEAPTEVLPGQLLKSVYFGLCGSLSVALRGGEPDLVLSSHCICKIVIQLQT